jgi:hypothetical protein
MLVDLWKIRQNGKSGLYLREPRDPIEPSGRANGVADPDGRAAVW